MKRAVRNIHKIPPALSTSVLVLTFGLFGCSSKGTDSANTLRPDSPAVKSGQKVLAPAPPDEKARAAGGSGMPSTAASSSGGGPGAGPTVYVDAPPDAKAQAVGGSGMPPIR